MSESGINAWIELTRRESNFCHLAQNPSSTAFSLFQFLDATWQGVGCVKTSDPDTVIPCGYRYIQNRYGNAQKALQFHSLKGWY